MSLIATVLTGGYLRAAVAWPALAGGVDLGQAVHAHSHVAFFGWLVLGAAALSVREEPAWSDRRTRAWALVVRAIGVLSLVALVAFARWGYALPTIVLSATHVGLWVALAAVLGLFRHRGAALSSADRWWRTAWWLLLVSGALTTLPAVLAARGIHGGWWRDFSIKLFLALFVNGFALMAAVGTLLPPRREWPLLDWVRRIYAVALLPLAVLYVDTAPPFAWLTTVSRIGIGVLGLCTLAIAWQLRRHAAGGTRLIALAGYILVGMLQLIAATGVADGVMRARPITIAFTHLELLLVVTPLLACALMPGLVRSWQAISSLSVGAAMCAALVFIGWPWLSAFPARLGVTYLSWFTTVGTLGVLAAVLFSALALRLLRMRAVSSVAPATAPRAPRTGAWRAEGVS